MFSDLVRKYYKIEHKIRILEALQEVLDEYVEADHGREIKQFTFSDCLVPKVESDTVEEVFELLADIKTGLAKERDTLSKSITEPVNRTTKKKKKAMK